MERKILLEAFVPLQRLNELRFRGDTDTVFNFADAIVVGQSQRLRLTLTTEPILIVTDFLSPEDRALDAARAELVRVLDSGYPPERRAAAIERLISARVGRALAIHCDADHDD